MPSDSNRSKDVLDLGVADAGIVTDIWCPDEQSQAEAEEELRTYNQPSDTARSPIMKRKVHIHIHKGAATQDAEPEGKWVTMHGSHVFIGKGGTIEKGPKQFMGKKPGELSDEGKGREAGVAHHNTKAHEHMETGHGHLGDDPNPAQPKKDAAQSHYAASHAHSKAAHAISQGDKTGKASKAAHETSEKLAEHEQMNDVHTKAAAAERASAKFDTNSKVKEMREKKAALHDAIAAKPEDHPPGSPVYKNIRELGNDIQHARELRTPGGVALNDGVQGEDGKRAQKQSKADSLAAAKKLHEDALKDEANFHDAADMYTAAGKPDKAAEMQAMARRQGHEPGKDPLAKHQQASRHAEKGGVPEGADRPGGPLKRGEQVRIVGKFAEGDTRNYTVVASESKGRVDIVDPASSMSIKPREVIDGYMIERIPAGKK